MILRQAAFAKEGTFLKGNLHCHTEDGQVYIQCSPVNQIILRNFSCPHRLIRGENLTSGQFKLRDLCTDYIRAEVVDAQGHRAWTNPIFLK